MTVTPDLVSQIQEWIINQGYSVNLDTDYEDDGLGALVTLSVYGNTQQDVVIGDIHYWKDLNQWDISVSKAERKIEAQKLAFALEEAFGISIDMTYKYAAYFSNVPDTSTKNERRGDNVLRAVVIAVALLAALGYTYLFISQQPSQ